MVYKVQFKKSVGRDLRKINKTQVRAILGKIKSGRKMGTLVGK